MNWVSNPPDCTEAALKAQPRPPQKPTSQKRDVGHPNPTHPTPLNPPQLRVPQVSLLRPGFPILRDSKRSPQNPTPPPPKTHISKARCGAPKPYPPHHPQPTPTPGAPGLASETWVSTPPQPPNGSPQNPTPPPPKPTSQNRDVGHPKPYPPPPPLNPLQLRVPQVSLLRPGFPHHPNSHGVPLLRPTHKHPRPQPQTFPLPPQRRQLRLNLHHPPLPHLVVSITRPPPLPRFPHQPPAHRILVHVIKLLPPACDP